MRGNLFENFIIMEALKHRHNQGKESNLYFYRDSNQNEVDLILRNRESLCGIEIKSSMTYNSQFEKGLKHIDAGVKEKVTPKAIVYAGDFENTTGEIQLLNYTHLERLL